MNMFNRNREEKIQKSTKMCCYFKCKLCGNIAYKYNDVSDKYVETMNLEKPEDKVSVYIQYPSYVHTTCKATIDGKPVKGIYDFICISFEEDDN